MRRGVELGTQSKTGFHAFHWIFLDFRALLEFSTKISLELRVKGGSARGKPNGAGPRWPSSLPNLHRRW